jgi:hypothetical protein
VYITSDLCIGSGTDGIPDVLSLLLGKMTDRNARTAREACKCIMALARTGSRGVAGLEIVYFALLDATAKVCVRMPVSVCINIVVSIFKNAEMCACLWNRMCACL